MCLKIARHPKAYLPITNEVGFILVFCKITLQSLMKDDSSKSFITFVTLKYVNRRDETSKES